MKRQLKPNGAMARREVSGMAQDETPSSTSRPSFVNSILSRLSPSELDKMAPALDRVTLEKKQVVNYAGKVPTHVYFPEGGILSFTLPLPLSGHVEFGILGRDGLSSFSAFLGRKASPVDVLVQVGDAETHRIDTDTLWDIYRSSDELRTLVFEYLYRFMSQMAYTAVSNARHSLPERLARWLLMCNDRLDGRDIPLTHEFLAMMLGAQRTSVTTTLHILEGEGAIISVRGIVRMRSRSRLEQCAGEAYDRNGVGNPR